MATKDRIYQDVLRLLGDARLATSVDDVESRYALDDAWEEAVTFVLRQAPWRMALKTRTLAYAVDQSVKPAGFQYLYAFPSDSLRTVKIVVVTADGRECPVDHRESNVGIAANVASLTIWYISSLSDAWTDEETGEPILDDVTGEPIGSERDFTVWPEHLAQALAAYLAFLICERVTGERGASARFSQLFSQLLEEAARLDAVAEDRWMPYQRTGELLIGARDLLKRGAWRFAMTDIVITATGATPGEAITDETTGSPITDEETGEAWTVTSGSRVTGLMHSFRQPADWLLTHKLFGATADGREYPIDAREQGGYWATQVSRFTARYVSTTRGLDSTKWEEPFRSALLAYLEAGRPSDTPSQDGQAPVLPQWQQAVALALQACAEPPDLWLPHQLSGNLARDKHNVLEEGFWAWRGPDGVMRGLKEQQYSATDDQVEAQPSYAFPYRFQLPTDHFKTHALFVPWDGTECPININESGHDWSTDAETFVARYVSTDVLDAAFWPEPIKAAVLGYLQARYAPVAEKQAREAEAAMLLAAARDAYSRPPSEWLPFQLSGKYPFGVRELLEQGRWRFAIRTVDLTESTDPIPAELSDGTASSGYAYRFIRPNDLLRTVWVHYLQGAAPYGRRLDIDFRDEGGAFHANFTPITVRYVSRLGLDSTKWPAGFHDAVLAWLKYSEARADVRLVAQAAALLQIFEDRARDVERLDDARDRPVIRGSRILAARRGYGRVVGPLDSGAGVILN